MRVMVRSATQPSSVLAAVFTLALTTLGSTPASEGALAEMELAAVETEVLSAERLAKVVAGLSAEEAVDRDDSERALQPFLRDPRWLAQTCAQVSESGVPEVTSRFSRAVIEDGRTFGAQWVVARAMERRSSSAEGGGAPDDADRAAGGAAGVQCRSLLRQSLRVVLAEQGQDLPLRGDLEDRSYVFREGLLTGVRFPMGPAVRFESAIDWLTHGLPMERPLVVDPVLDVRAIRPVRPIELLPTTADALLGRILDARDLGVVDLGVAFVIMGQAEADRVRGAIAEVLDRPTPEGEDAGAGRRRERRLRDDVRADWLAGRLLDPTLEAWELSRVFQAIAPVGARAALARAATAREGDALGTGEVARAGAVFGEDHAFDLRRITSGVDPEPRSAIVAVAFLDLVRRPAAAAPIVSALLTEPDRSTLPFACRLAATLRLSEVAKALEEIADQGPLAAVSNEDRADAALALFEIAPLDRSARARLPGALMAGFRPQELRLAIEAALILSMTSGEDERLSFTWADESTSSSAAIVSAAVAAVADLTGPEDEALSASRLQSVAGAAGPRAAEAWILTRIGSPLAGDTLAPDVIAAGLALDLSPGTEAVLRAHHLRQDGLGVRDQVAAALQQDGEVALAALVLEAVRDLKDDGYRASFLKSALDRSGEPDRVASACRELSEVLRAAEPGAQVIWLDPRRGPPP